jgi:mannosyltransferase
LRAVADSRLALGAIVALAAALRFTALDTQSFWLDEAFTRLLVREHLGEMLDNLPDSESTPPLYYALVWAWAKVFGSGEAGLRSLSALLGTATVPVAYLVGRELASRAAGLVLALLTAVSPFLVWYSQEARAYALAILLVALSLLLTVRAARDPRRMPLSAWALTAAAALLTHYFTLFVVIAEIVWLYRAGLRRTLVFAALPLVAVGFALLPLALDQSDNGGAQVGDESVASRLGDVPREFLVGQFGGPVRGLGPLAAVLIAAGLVIAAARLAPDVRRRALASIAVGAAAVLGALVGSAVGFDFLTPRHLTVAWIPLFAGAAVAFAATRATAAAGLALAAVFLVVTVAVPLTPRLQRDDWRSAAASLGDSHPDRAIVVSPDVGFVPLDTYRPRVTAPPGSSFAIRELDLVVMIRDGRDPPRISPLRGFRLVATDRDATYVTARFASGRAREVTGLDLLLIRPTPDPTGFVYEPASR